LLCLKRSKGISGWKFCLGIGVVAIVFTALWLSGIVSWVSPGTLIADDIVAVSCDSNRVDITIKEYEKQTGYAEGDFCFHRDSSVILHHEGCSGMWEEVKINQPGMTSARWGGYDISQFFGSPTVINVLGNFRVCSHYTGADGDISTYLYDKHGERFSSSNENDIEFTFRFSEVTDPCEGVICQPSVATCPDGEMMWCDTACIPESGLCSTCIPDCTGHDAQPEDGQPGEDSTTPPSDEEPLGEGTEWILTLLIAAFIIGTIGLAIYRFKKS